ncbi:MAG: hypothetical protein NXI22_04740 [bacterium]|nr:hypothetical protein [bacterium]
MNHAMKTLFASLAVVCLLISPSFAEEGKSKEKLLDAKEKGVHKLAVSYSQIGPRNTLVFYTFPKQQAVLRVMIDNKSKDFPISAKVHLFADDVTEDGLKKWLNNQHSDGIYPEVPEPVATHNLPTKASAIKSSKLVKESNPSFGAFADYLVEFRIASSMQIEGVEVKEFVDTAEVHLKK